MEKLAKRLVESTWEMISDEALQSAKNVLLDTIGAMLAGMKEASMQTLVEQHRSLHSGSFAVFGTGEKMDLYASGYLNGTATVAVELDEGNQWSKGHPAAHVVPTMLTYVQTKEQYSGKQFILNVIKAYEACSQFGRATTLLPNAHAHGTWGVLGAAASTLLLDDVSQEQLLEGLNISATFAVPTMWTAALEGALIRNIYVGQAVEAGLKTTSLLKSQFYAPKNNVQYIFTHVIGSDFEPACFSDGESGWDIERNYFKTHAFCRYAHAPLEAFQSLIQEHEIKADEIKKVNVYTYERAASLSSSAYHNTLSAKFSIPFSLSAWLFTQKTDHSLFQQETLDRDDIRQLAKKVNVEASPELEKNYPTIMPAEVSVTLHTGDVYKKRLDNADGGPDEKMAQSYLIEKFKTNTDGILSAERQEKIIEWIDTIEEKTSMSELIALLS